MLAFSSLCITGSGSARVTGVCFAFASSPAEILLGATNLALGSIFIPPPDMTRGGPSTALKTPRGLSSALSMPRGALNMPRGVFMQARPQDNSEVVACSVDIRVGT